MAAPDEQAGGRLLTVVEVAQRLRYTERTVRVMIRTGSLPAVKVGPQWRVLDTVVAEVAAGRRVVVGERRLGGKLPMEPDVYGCLVYW